MLLILNAIQPMPFHLTHNHHAGCGISCHQHACKQASSTRAADYKQESYPLSLMYKLSYAQVVLHAVKAVE